jgi:uncharacterized membrane protein
LHSILQTALIAERRLTADGSSAGRLTGHVPCRRDTQEVERKMPEQVTRSIIVRAEVPVVFRLWSRFENFPAFMKHIRSVTRTGDGSSHWVMDGPLGKALEWDAQVTRFEENKRIAWNSTPDSQMRTSGQVTFTELGPAETQVTVMMHYVPPAGFAGEALDDLVADPGGNLEEDLRRFKAYAEGRSVETPVGAHR